MLPLIVQKLALANPGDHSWEPSDIETITTTIHAWLDGHFEDKYWSEIALRCPRMIGLLASCGLSTGAPPSNAMIASRGGAKAVSRQGDQFVVLLSELANASDAARTPTMVADTSNT